MSEQEHQQLQQIQVQAQKPDTSKQEMIQNIKEWIKLDNEITKLKAEVKERDTKKKQLTTNLVEIMKSNAIDCFDINGGALVYKQRKTKKPITGKSLLEALDKYYSNDPEKAKEITQHVLDNRAVSIKEIIHRKIDNPTDLK